MKKSLILFGGLILFILAPSLTLAADATASGIVTVSSSTHPDSSTWYAKSDVSISWSRPDGAYGFSFKFDQVPHTVPNDSLDTTITTTKKFTDLSDGTWYFHIKARSLTAGFGPTTTFPVLIDTTKPAAPQVQLTNDGTQNPVISFTSEDKGSGVDYYQILLDGETVAGKAMSPYTIKNIETPGKHIVEVAAYDRAGNLQSTTLPIQISIPEPPADSGLLNQPLTLPVYTWLVLNLLALFLAVWLWIVLARRKKQNVPVSKPISENGAPVGIQVKTVSRPRKRPTRSPRKPRLKQDDKIFE